MSTHSWSENCCFCGGKDSLMICQDTNPPSIDYVCVECGMYSKVEVHRMELDELNEDRRLCFDLPKLNKRRETYDETYINNIDNRDPNLRMDDKVKE